MLWLLLNFSARGKIGGGYHPNELENASPGPPVYPGIELPQTAHRYHRQVPYSYFHIAAVELEGTGARMSWKTDTQIEVWYWKPANEERYVERQDGLSIFPPKDGLPLVLFTQGAVPNEVNKGCIQVCDSLQTRVEAIFKKKKEKKTLM